MLAAFRYGYRGCAGSSGHTGFAGRGNRIAGRAREPVHRPVFSGRTDRVWHPAILLRYLF
ncbi:hypothetical protein D3C81_1924850 [compost metagenome]